MAKRKPLLALLALCALASFLAFAYPMYVIRPFRAQGPRELVLALAVFRWGPLTASIAAAAAILLAFALWSGARRIARLFLVTLAVLTVFFAVLSRVNVYERMFHRIDSPDAVSASDAKVDGDDMVLAVNLHDSARAYPIRTMGYHHIANDWLGGVPIAATYCTLCHTGLVWNRLVDGRALTFRLAGINNQNALMRDEETGSFWQQTTGKAISGPYQGRQLELVHSDEVTFALWRGEHPQGTVLRAVDRFEPEYETKDWETRMRKTRTVTDTTSTPWGPRELMLGVTDNGASRGFVLSSVLSRKLVADRVGGTPVIVVVGPDDKSIRVFEARVKGRDDVPEFYRSTGSGDDRPFLMDSLTGSAWNFQGCAVSGTAMGQCLRPLPASKDYWFDWHRYHPDKPLP